MDSPAVAAFIAVAGLVVAAIMWQRSRANSPDMQTPGHLAPGWVFIAHPTSGDKPGTLFRIDADGVRANLTKKLVVDVETTSEEFGSHHAKASTSLDVVAQGLGLPLRTGVEASVVTELALELEDVKHEFVNDDELERALKPFLADHSFTPGNRYFVIRATRSATAMTYSVSRGQLAKLEVNAELPTIVTAKGTLHRSETGETYKFGRPFKGRRRVMYLAQELRPPGSTSERPASPGSMTTVPAWTPRAPRDTELDFFMACLLTPVVDALGEPWLANAQLELGLQNGPHLLGWGRFRARSKQSREALEAREAVLAFLAQNPGAKDRLANLVRMPSVDLRGARTEDEVRIDRYWAILAATFATASLMRRPMALRGFLNTSLCVAVVDARTKIEPVPIPAAPQGLDRSEIYISYGTPALVASIDELRPRLWIIPATSTESRDSIAEALNARFDVQTELVPDPQTVMRLAGDAGGHYVQRIRAHWIDVEGDTTAPDVDPFHAIGNSLEGMELCRADLEHQLRQRWLADEFWRMHLLSQ